MITYKPLKHLLIEKNTNVTRLCSEIGLSTGTRNSLNTDKHVSLGTIEKICIHLGVPIERVVKVIIQNNER